MAGEGGGPIPLPIEDIAEAVGGLFGGGGGSFVGDLLADWELAGGRWVPRGGNVGQAAPRAALPGRTSPIPGPTLPPTPVPPNIIDLLKLVLSILQQFGVLPQGGGGGFGGSGQPDSRPREAGNRGDSIGPPIIINENPAAGGGGGGFSGQAPPIGGDVPFITMEGGGFGLGGNGILGTGITGGDIASIIGAVRGGGGGGGNAALPGGAALGGGMFDLPGIDIVPQGQATCGSAFRPTRSGMSAQRHIKVNPASGRMQWFGPIGNPVLWSGDLAAAKRVKKVAARARRRVGGR